jgi:CheY-like chemotaxis protein
MSPEVAERIFDPFFTTKPQGQGTGLGLSVSAGIITSHRGFVRVYSEPGKGTRFLVHLPAAREATPPVPATGADLLPTGSGELVLVVDDEEQVRTTLGHSLEQYGYRVLHAAGGAEAVELLRVHTDDVAVVLTDMMMPGVDAPTMVRRIHAIAPDLPIIAASGLHSERRILDDLSLHIDQFLPKPFTLRALLLALRTALTPPASPPAP